jgi:DNA-3-methyladenine glycosylase
VVRGAGGVGARGLARHARPPAPRPARLSGGPSPRERARLAALLAQPTIDAARGLLGCVLVRTDGQSERAVRIVETEAYLGEDDPAAHAYAGRTARTEPLFGPPGTVYVYFVYGVHHCLNLAVDRPGVPGCVLVRAAEPLPGSGLEPSSCRGPGRLCRALGIDARLSGRHLFEADPPLTLREGTPPEAIGVSVRVGITRAAERPLRFYDAASACVSSPRPPGVSSRAAGRGLPPAATTQARRRGRR